MLSGSRAWTFHTSPLQTRAIDPLAPPKSDIHTPFTKFVNIASPQPGATPCALSSESSTDSETKAFLPPPALDHAFTLFRARKFQTAHQDVQHCARLQRKQSRSTSRRSASLASSTDSDRGHRPWHIAPNSHCNGGLKNAIDSIRGRLTQKLWVGTLGSSTDGFGPKMRKSIDKKMREMSGSVPVWIPDGEFESCYDEFCHQVGVFQRQLGVAYEPDRYCGLVCTIQSQTHPRRSSSMKAHHSSSTGRSISALQTLSSKTTVKATSVSNILVLFLIPP